MNLCQLAQSQKCPHGKLRVSQMTCARCPLYQDSGKPWSMPATDSTVTTWKPIPREKWGVGLAPWIELATPADRGIGDTLKRHERHVIDGLTGASVLQQLTVDCKWCGQRAEMANALYPFSPDRSDLPSQFIE